MATGKTETSDRITALAARLEREVSALKASSAANASALADLAKRGFERIEVYVGASASSKHTTEFKAYPAGTTLAYWSVVQHNAIVENGWNYCRCVAQDNSVIAEYHSHIHNPNGLCRCAGLCLRE